jgi:hypothetical protein
MKTAPIKALALEVLDALPKPYTEDVIDDLFGAIQHNPEWLKEYKQLCDKFSKTVVNTWSAYWVANALGKVGERQVPAKNSKLIASYSLLDTDARTIVRKPKETKAREMMAAYYQAHKAELPTEIRKHRELIIELIMEGTPPAQTFQQVLANN